MRSAARVHFIVSVCSDADRKWKPVWNHARTHGLVLSLFRVVSGIRQSKIGVREADKIGWLEIDSPRVGVSEMPFDE